MILFLFWMCDLSISIDGNNHPTAFYILDSNVILQTLKLWIIKIRSKSSKCIMMVIADERVKNPLKLIIIVWNLDLMNWTNVVWLCLRQSSNQFGGNRTEDDSQWLREKCSFMEIERSMQFHCLQPGHQPYHHRWPWSISCVREQNIPRFVWRLNCVQINRHRMNESAIHSTFYQKFITFPIHEQNI